MMVGPEPSIQAALARLARPPAATGGWVAKRARELARDHEAWIVTAPAPVVGAEQSATVFSPVRQFALGIRLTDEPGIDGEAVTDSDASAEKIIAWIDQMKTTFREKTGVGALDALVVKRTGPALQFVAKSDSLIAGEAGKSAMSSDFGVELNGLLCRAFPVLRPERSRPTNCSRSKRG